MENQSNNNTSPLIQTGSFRTINWLKVLMGVIGIGVLMAGSFYMGHKWPVRTTSNNSNSITNNIRTSTSPTNVTPTTQKLKGSQIISVDVNTDKYINYDIGLSITYHKNFGDYSKCNGINAELTSDPIKIIADTTSNKIYVAPSHYSITTNKQLSNGNYGAASCTTADTDLNAINDSKPATVTGGDSSVYSMTIDYTRVVDSNGLNSFIKGLFPAGNIIIDNSVNPSQAGTTYSYKLKCVNPVGEIHAVYTYCITPASN